MDGHWMCSLLIVLYIFPSFMLWSCYSNYINDSFEKISDLIPVKGEPLRKGKVIRLFYFGFLKSQPHFPSRSKTIISIKQDAIKSCECNSHVQCSFGMAY